jgi:hypothetical protein
LRKNCSSDKIKLGGEFKPLLLIQIEWYRYSIRYLNHNVVFSYKW